MMHRPAALVQGASRGIGLALVRLLLAEGSSVIATSRAPHLSDELNELHDHYPHALHTISLDVEDQASLSSAAAEVRSRVDQLDLLVNAAGLLHDGDLRPERRLEEVDANAMVRSFRVNALGPILVAQHFLPLLNHERRAVLANISARVGSIEDNRKGGWYAYRASKAAQNMLTKTLAIEMRRRAPNLIVLALHPGTVATDLSAPFQGFVPHHQLFSPERAATQLLQIMRGAGEEHHGCFFAWDGQRIPW